MSAPLVIPIAHDFNCEWCWVGMHQAKRLREAFGVKLEWRGYEQHPQDDPWPDAPARPQIPGKPQTPTRHDLFCQLHELQLPAIERPKKVRTWNAHQTVEHFKEKGLDPDPIVEAIYDAYWERGLDIADPAVLCELASPFTDPGELAEALAEGRYRDRTVKFDAAAYKTGVFNVPTFWIGDERFAEQPYVVLKQAVERILGEGADIYTSLTFPAAGAERPYIAINMVATIDGKIITGERDEPVIDLGSKLDHRLMKRIESAFDAVILGAQTLRAAKKSWNPKVETRIVVSGSGDLPYDSCFFTGTAIVASPNEIEVPEGTQTLRFESIPSLIALLRERGIERLLLLGGSSLNSQFFQLGLVDEIFLTVAPKIKLGAETPTIADGEPLPRERIQNYSIVEQHRVGDELFVRYRRNS